MEAPSHKTKYRQLMKHSFQGNWHAACLWWILSPKLSKVRCPDCSFRDHRRHLPFSDNYRAQAVTCRGCESHPGCPKAIQSLVEMCRGAPRYCVPLLVHVPMSGLEKCCSVHHQHIPISLERC